MFVLHVVAYRKRRARVRVPQRMPHRRIALGLLEGPDYWRDVEPLIPSAATCPQGTVAGGT